MDPRLDWLLQCADQLNSSTELGHAVNVRKIVAHLGIRLCKRIDLSLPKVAGRLNQDGDSSFSITIVRTTNKPIPLRVRERFTIAHEIAHYLLIKKFGWNPQTGKEYQRCEHYCDQFAARLLVPVSLIKEIAFSNAQGLYLHLNSLRRNLNVSLEVLARSFVAQNVGIATCMIDGVTRNCKGQEVLRVIWGATSSKLFRCNSKAYIIPDTHEHKKLSEAWKNALGNSAAGFYSTSLASIYAARIALISSKVFIVACEQKVTSQHISA